ncbi:hypothetical protein SAMN05444487_10984 [Marininema mesophilum]|uniref:Uncharacterized protein n=1 Tax=Marininema mesophilum TaxID=1048340 RepID=A0A1H2YIM0_9BACL|nr:hypothetical protein SAMN05444487_10984 [Marininema mesophilum]
MGYLESFRRPKAPKYKKFTVRLSWRVYRQFKKYCDRLGLSLNEAIHLLIKHELEQTNNPNELIHPPYRTSRPSYHNNQYHETNIFLKETNEDEINKDEQSP